jgi:pimeloyl-ACP methyl ester carboxylesterase
VLLHGFGGRIEEMNDLAAALTPGFRVLRLDLRGFGESSHPHDSSQYGVHIASDVIDLLDRLGERLASVVGYSLGAAVAAKVAARHPERVRRLVFIGGGPQTDSSRIMRIGNEAAAALEQGRGLRPFFFALTPAGRPLPSDSVMEAVSRQVLADGDSVAWAALLRSQRELVLTDAEVRSLRMPTLFLAGTDDLLGAEARQWRGVLPRTQFVTVPGATHDNVLGRPEVAREVARFLRGVPQR